MSSEVGREGPCCRSFRVELPDGRAYWTVVDEAYLKVDIADRFLFDLRFGRDRAESTTRAYAGELAGFLSWCRRSGRSLEDGAARQRPGGARRQPQRAPSRDRRA